MNKFIKIAFSLIITGFILIGFATYLNNGNIPRFSSNSEKKNYTVSVNDVKNLDIDIIDSDVTIEENTASKNIEIEYYTALERKVNIEHTGNKLSIFKFPVAKLISASKAEILVIYTSPSLLLIIRDLISRFLIK